MPEEKPKAESVSPVPHPEAGIINKPVLTGPHEPLQFVSPAGDIVIKEPHSIEELPAKSHIPSQQSLGAVTRGPSYASVGQRALGASPDLRTTKIMVGTTGTVPVPFFLQYLEEAGQIVARSQLIVIEEQDIFATGVLHSVVSGCVEPRVFLRLVMEIFGGRGAGDFFNHQTSVIARTIINDQQLELICGKLQLHQTLETILQQIRSIVGAYHHAEDRNERWL